MRRRNGSSLAELAIMLPIYVVLVTAAVYLAQISLTKYGAHKATGYAAAQKDSQSVNDAIDIMIPSGPVTVTGFSDEIDPEEMWDGEDINGVLEEIARAPVGHYELRGGEIVYILDEDRLSAYGDYIFDNDLQAESDNVAAVLSGWMYRTRSEMTCTYTPRFGDWDPAVLNEIGSSSYVSGGLERGTHPPEDPDFNRDIFRALSDENFPSPLADERYLWLPQVP